MNEHTIPAQHQDEIRTKDRLAVLIAELHSSGIFFSEAERQFKKQYVTHVLRSCNGNQCRAAIELGWHRNTMSRTIAKLKLDRRDWDPRRQLSGRFPAQRYARDAGRSVA